MGVDGCWCAPRSSKPVRGVKSLSGEFDPHMLPPEPRGRVPRGFLKNVDFPLDRTEGSSYNTTVRGVSRTISYPGVAQLVARMVRDHEAVSSNLATRTIIGPNIDTMCRCLVRFFLPGKPLTARLSAVSGCICTGVRHNQAPFRRCFPETSTLAGKANVSNGHNRFNKESP